MKEIYISNLNRLDLASRLAREMIILLEKYNPETSYAQSLYSMANTHKQLLNLEINCLEKAWQSYKSQLVKDGFNSSVILMLEKDFKSKRDNADEIYRKIDSILSYTFKF